VFGLRSFKFLRYESNNYAGIILWSWINKKQFIQGNCGINKSQSMSARLSEILIKIGEINTASRKAVGTY